MLATVAMPALAAPNGNGDHENKAKKVCLVFIKYAKWDDKVLKGKKFFWVKKDKAEWYVDNHEDWDSNGEDDGKWFKFYIKNNVDDKWDCLDRNDDEKKVHKLPFVDRKNDNGHNGHNGNNGS